MGSDEEYLDNLLKSVSADSGERKAMTEEEIAALFSTTETPQTNPNTEITIDDVFTDILMEDESVDSEELVSQFEGEEDDILALDDTASDFDTDFSAEYAADEPVIGEGEYDFVLDELGAESFEEPFKETLEETVEESFEETFEETVEESAEEPFEDPDLVLEEDLEMSLDEPMVPELAKQDFGSDFLDEQQVQSLMESDADLFDLPEDESDLVDLESLDIDAELGIELIENLPVEIEEVPDTEEIEQGDMLDIASMFDTQEDLTEGVTYDTSGFYEDEPEEEDFNPFADMSDIDDLLKAVNWGAESKDEDTQDTGDETSEGVFLENMDQITSEELESMLPKEEMDLENETDVDALVDDFDLSSLGESEDADMAELGALLQMADGENEALDLFGDMEDDTPSGGEILQIEEEDPKAKKARIKQEKADEKARKKAEKTVKKALKEVEDMPEPKYKKVKESDSETIEKKEGFFGKFLNALLEEEPEPEKKKPTEEIIEIDENQDILETLDKEDKDKKKKEKKEKPKKEKKEKPKKEKNAKKAKPIKEKVIDLEPPAKIRRNSIIIVVGFAASLLVLVLLGNAIVQPIISKHNGKKAFEEMQYEECYQLFAGQKLSDEEQLMLEHASVVLKIQRRLWKYEEYASLKNKVSALDSLFDAVANYDDWYQDALNCGARSEVEDSYAEILSILNTYGISESQAQMIVTLDDVEYTRALTTLAEDGAIEYIFKNEEDAEHLPDLLPGETD